MSRSLALTVAALLTVASGPALGLTIPLASTIDGPSANAGAGTGSLGTGSASLTFDDQTLLLSWSGSFSGLTDDFTVSHFHGPATLTQSAGVTVGIGVTLNPDNRSGTFVGSATLTAGQAADLLAGLWYINIHSLFQPAGEIRGQVNVIPEPGTLGLVALGLAGLALRRRTVA